MQVIHERCCGLDVHKKSITACIVTTRGKEIKTFGTVTSDILQLADWIRETKCTHVAMESTGVYWKPVYNLLELQEVELLVVNAHHIKAVPGRKTDVKDAEWIADLLRHGLLKGSYIPSREQRELRELVRYRKSLIEERAREANRLQKVLEGCNIKLSSVVSNILGVSSRSMIEAIINGIEDPILLAQLSKGKMKKKVGDLEQALLGITGIHQKKILSAQLKHIDFLDEQIEQLDSAIGEQLSPFKEDLELLETIPGVGVRTAELLLAEIGSNLNRFPTDAHLSSWAGMAPGNNESAGKRKSGKTRKGNKHLRSALVQSARAAAKGKTYLSAQFHRISARRGGNRAAIAVGHSILVMAYHILKRREPYKELGANYFDERKSKAVVRNAIRRIEKLGFSVKIEEISA